MPTDMDRIYRIKANEVILLQVKAYSLDEVKNKIINQRSKKGQESGP